MGLEEAVQLDAGQTEHLSQLYCGNATGPERFEGYAFQRHAREVAAGLDKAAANVVWYLNVYLHGEGFLVSLSSLKHMGPTVTFCKSARRAEPVFFCSGLFGVFDQHLKILVATPPGMGSTRKPGKPSSAGASSLE